jgi:hypothetical protein
MAEASLTTYDEGEREWGMETSSGQSQQRTVSHSPPLPAHAHKRGIDMMEQEPYASGSSSAAPEQGRVAPAPRPPRKPKPPSAKTLTPSPAPAEFPNPGDAYSPTPPDGGRDARLSPDSASSPSSAVRSASRRRAGNTSGAKRQATAPAAKPAADRSAHKTPRGGNPGDAFLVPIEELPPLTHGFEAVLKDLQAALVKGEVQETWIEKCEGLELVRRLIRHETEASQAKARELVALVNVEVSNLRSSVSRLAILTMGDMYEYLGRAMEKSLETTVVTLQNKAGAEASGFIKQEVADCLERMVVHTSPVRALMALLACADHKIKEVRRVTGRLVCEMVERLGAKVLNMKETPRFIRLIAKALSDSDQEVRYWARCSAAHLLEADELESCVNLHLNGEMKRTFETALDAIRTKGIEPAPGARTMRRTVAGGTASTRRPRAKPPASAGQALETESPVPQPPSATRRQRGTSGRVLSGQASQKHTPSIRAPGGGDRLGELSTELQAPDWRKREAAVGDLQALVQERPQDFVSTNMNVFFDFVPRLSDSNSKVNVAALQALEVMLPLVGPAMDTVMGELLPALAHNLASKAPSIRAAACANLAFIAQHLDSNLVLQPMCTTVVNANGVVKEGLIPYLSAAVATASDDARTARLIQRYAVSACVKLAADKKLESALAGAWRQLYDVLGEDLLKHKAMKPAALAQVKAIVM